MIHEILAYERVPGGGRRRAADRLRLRARQRRGLRRLPERRDARRRRRCRAGSPRRSTSTRASTADDVAPADVGRVRGRRGQRVRPRRPRGADRGRRRRRRPLSERVGRLADLEQMTRMWAVERYIGHWDGYAARPDRPTRRTTTTSTATPPAASRCCPGGPTRPSRPTCISTIPEGACSNSAEPTTSAGRSIAWRRNRCPSWPLRSTSIRRRPRSRRCWHPGSSSIPAASIRWSRSTQRSPPSMRSSRPGRRMSPTRSTGRSARPRAPRPRAPQLAATRIAGRPRAAADLDRRRTAHPGEDEGAPPAGALSLRLLGARLAVRVSPGHARVAPLRLARDRADRQGPPRVPRACHRQRRQYRPLAGSPRLAGARAVTSDRRRSGTTRRVSLFALAGRAWNSQRFGGVQDGMALRCTVLSLAAIALHASAASGATGAAHRGATRPRHSSTPPRSPRSSSRCTDAARDDLAAIPRPTCPRNSRSQRTRQLQRHRRPPPQGHDLIRTLDGKAAFKVKFKEFGGEKFLGLRS